jgi:hypothetical protein
VFVYSVVISPLDPQRSATRLFNPTENSHFRKYLATLGVSIALAALAAGGFLFRGQSELLIDQKKLTELTPTARQAIERRQEIILFATQWSPLAVGLFCLAGITIAVIGLKGWARRQISVDSREDMEAEKTAAEIRALTAEEKKIKLEDDVQIAVGNMEVPTEETNKKLTDNVPPEPRTAEEPDSPSVETEENRELRSVNRRTSLARNAISNIEQTLIEKLESAFSHGTVQPTVAVEAGEGRVFGVDALITFPKSKYNYLIEVKYVANKKSLRNAVDQAAIQVVAAASSMNSTNPHLTYFPVVFIITDDESTAFRNQARLALSSLSPALALTPLVLQFTRSELSSIDPIRLRITIGMHFRDKSLE